MNSFSILGTHIANTSYVKAAQIIIVWAQNVESRAVFAANVHMVMEAYDSPEFEQIVNSADIVTPDGMPLVWIMRARGYCDQERVYGPHLMLKVLQSAEEQDIPVGFIGSTPEILEKLTTNLAGRYPKLSIVCRNSPPYRALSPEEDDRITKEVVDSGTRILFVGLGCPKQEYWIHQHRGSIPAVMIGVGAAFDFYAGTVAQAPAWMQRSGLEWLYRLSREPARLWKRYLYNNPKFAILAAIEQVRFLLKRRNG